MREQLTADVLDSLDDPEMIWRYVAPLLPYAGRRQRAAAVAIARMAAHLFVDPRSARAVELIAADLEGDAAIEAQAEAELIADEAREFCSFARNANSGQLSAAVAALRLAEWAVEGMLSNVQNALAWEADPEYKSRYTSVSFAVARTQAKLLQCVFGNPLRPVAFAPVWRTSTAVALASQMDESRDFSPMPILADALEDAGCDNADVLNHCRGPGPHVRGCWVVDLVLGNV